MVEAQVSSDMQEFYKTTLENRLIAVEKSIPRVYFTQEEQEFFRRIKDIKDKGFPEMADEYLEKYFQKRIAYIKSCMKHF